MTPAPAGASWKELRESMGKTIAQVSAELRIGQRYLAGIEEGNFGDFPERVFSTGFIRSYAKYLSQDPGPVLAEYERSIGSRDDSDTAASCGSVGWNGTGSVEAVVRRTPLPPGPSSSSG